MDYLTRADRLLCAAYGGCAVVALVLTWSNNLAFFADGSTSIVDFVKGGYVNGAAASLTNDLLLLGLAVFILMFVEARRLRIRFVWVYVILSFLVAMSVAFPLFLIARQIRIAQTRRARTDG